MILLLVLFCSPDRHTTPMACSVVRQSNARGDRQARQHLLRDGVIRQDRFYIVGQWLIELKRAVAHSTMGGEALQGNSTKGSETLNETVNTENEQRRWREEV